MPDLDPISIASSPARIKRRIGMLTPSSNTVLEPVCATLVAGCADVSVHYARFRVTEIGLSERALGQFEPAGMLEAAGLLADADVDVICWNGTSASWLGLDRDRDLCKSIHASTGIPATSSVLAMVEVLRAQGLRRIALVTPYVDDVQARIVETLGQEGFEIVAERHAGMSVNVSFPSLEQETLAAMIESVAAAKPDAILIVCTNLAGAPLVDRLERRLGIPILDSVATTMFGAFREIGLPSARIQGFGRLFDDFGRDR